MGSGFTDRNLDLPLPRAYPRPRCGGPRLRRPPPVSLDIEGYDDADDNKCHETRPYERMVGAPDQVAASLRWPQRSANACDAPPR